ncbi:MAG: 2-dehydropantoate 2-reductase [Gammaproteobacteria bacterium]|nr:2-dehydropantoate 2-reductase [Gammaproteobacteria bacterium]MCY4218027.1 2-dehydropantoate 2-reductase [Gammaproteobacteria bacterium]MCY4274587.1 2-dehydropantoate 2-reductase [Gammaproteobacteria bacterium]
MKICIVGAGAIGGLMGARLAQSGHDISLIARGPHLRAIQKKGLAISFGEDIELVQNLVATGDMSELGHQDLVVMSLKAHQISAVADRLPCIIGPKTAMVTVQNGIPWWYFQKLGGDYQGRVVESVDPDGLLAKSIDPDCLIGCIAYPAAVITEPGVIHHVEGNRFPIGELDGRTTERITRVSEALIHAGFKSPILDDIRSEVWLKLWGNLSFNPISALTHATLEGICQFPLSRELAASMMTEAKAIAERLGASFRVSLEKRIEGAEKVGRHKTSMLQDVESGKPLEIDGMLGAVIELAEVVQVEVPTLQAVYSCVSLLDHTLQTENLRVQAQPKII